MAFTSTVESDGTERIGRLKICTGTYTSTSGSTGGDIQTGLSEVYSITLQPKGSAVIANQPAVNETLPLASGDVTIVTTADEIGTWTAIGR